jgi:hypothetical protein
MATKRKAGSKKGSARKKVVLPDNDPPIVVSGGGGTPTPGIRKPGKNIVEVEFDPEGGPGKGKFKSKVNKDATITGVQIDFPGMGVASVNLNNYEFYKIQIKFITAAVPKSVKRGAAASRKGKTSGGAGK